MTGEGVTKEEFDKLTGGVNLAPDPEPTAEDVPSGNASFPAGVSGVPMVITGKNGATYYADEVGSWDYVPLGFFLQKGRREYFDAETSQVTDGDFLVPFGQVEDIQFFPDLLIEYLKEQEDKAA